MESDGPVDGEEHELRVQERLNQSRRKSSLVDRVYTVLLVDNDPDDCKFVATLLKNCKYEVVTARNGREALQLMDDEAGGGVDVILTDNLTPEVGGVELIRTLAQSECWQHVPVIVMSSDGSQAVVLEAFKAGAADVLIKPIRRNELTTLWQHAWRANRIAPRSRSSDNPSSISGHTTMKALGVREKAIQEDTSPQGPSFARPAVGTKPLVLLGSKRPNSDELPTAAKQPRRTGQAAKTAALNTGKPLNPDQPSAPGSAETENDEPPKGNEGSKVSRPDPSAIEASTPTTWQSNMDDLVELLLSNVRRKSGSPTGVGMKGFEIKPLDLSMNGSTRQSSLEAGQLQYPGLALAPANSLCSEQSRDLNGSLEALHHSNAHSAFSSFSATAPVRSAPGGELEDVKSDAAGVNGGMMKSVGCPQSILLQQHQNFFQAFQAAMKQQQTTATACAANRKAAIQKFRAKRKQRSFEKKVRYASRQRLAETRPRVRGQFVKAEPGANAAPASTDAAALPSVK